MKWFWLLAGFLFGIAASFLLKICSFSALVSFFGGFVTGLTTSFLGNLFWEKFQKWKKEPYIKIKTTENGTEFQGYSIDPNSFKYLSKLNTSIIS